MPLNNISYTKNNSNVSQIIEHLTLCDKNFEPPLSSYVILDQYAKKLFTLSLRFEAWVNDKLVGLVALYINTESLKAFITNVSVISLYQGQGIAQKLLTKAIEEAKIYEQKAILLELFNTNKKAFNLYTNFGFRVFSNKNEKSSMALDIEKKEEITVSISCITFNHVEFIRQAIDGFLMQKTSFKYEILIHDDASTDGTAGIISEYESKYPDIIKPIYQTENQYSKGTKISQTYNWPRALGKYIALCEGDDYWTDPYKLQKQVDFLEGNEDYAICATLAKVQNNFTITNRVIGESGGFSQQDLATRNFIPTLTAMFRSKYAKNLPTWISTCPIGDWPLFLHCAEYGKINIMRDITAVYRVHENGVWSQNHKNDKTLRQLSTTLKLFEILKGKFSFEVDQIIEKNIVAHSRQLSTHLISTRQFDLLSQHLKKSINDDDSSNLLINAIVQTLTEQKIELSAQKNLTKKILNSKSYQLGNRLINVFNFKFKKTQDINDI